MPVVNAPDAFRQQLLGAIPRLRRYARSLVFDVHAADDLVQTALERALAHWHQFDQRRDILLWTISIAHNAFMDALSPVAYIVAQSMSAQPLTSVSNPDGPR